MASTDDSRPEEASERFLKLGSTLEDLFREEGLDQQEEMLYVPLLPSSRVQLASGIERGRIYPMYDPAYMGETYTEAKTSEVELEAGRQMLSVRYVCGAGQLMGFSAGSIPTIFIDPESLGPPPNERSDEVALTSLEKAKREAEYTYSIIHPSQRPQLVFADSLNELKVGVGQKLAPLNPMDGFIGKLCINTPAIQFTLSSKQALAESGLCTPKCVVIQFETLPPVPNTAANDCCTACRGHWNPEQIPSACSGHRKAWLVAETEKALIPILAKPLPYMLKLQHTMGGHGTKWARNPQELVDVAHFISRTYLPNHLPKLTEENISLRPFNILLSDIIDGPTRAVHFFVKRNGTFVYIGCNEQVLVGDRVWNGNSIDYSKHESLMKEMEATVDEVTRFCHREGYIGPVTIDTLQDRDGKHYIVDLNVRTGGSYVLGCLKPHFTGKGLNHACLLYLPNAQTSRERFKEEFRDKFKRNSVVIVGWYEITEEQSFGYIVVAGKTQEELTKDVQRVRDFAEGR